jgi:CheY-like chemotaxis protein
MVTVVVAEDSETMRQVIVMGLAREDDVTVLEAADGAQALRLVTTHEVDLLITDLKMPVLDGFKLIAAVRSDPRSASMRIAVITTEGGEKEREQAERLGADSFLAKPIELRQVEKLVHQLRDRA